MIRSMTGYGRAEALVDDKTLVAEIRAVNHRYLDVAVRSARTLQPLEHDVKRLVAHAVARGKVEVNLQFRGGRESDSVLELSLPQVARVRALLEQLRQETGAEGEIDLASLLAFRDCLVTVEEQTLDTSVVWQAVAAGIGQALDALGAMQQVEGAEMGRDIEVRLDTLEEICSAIQQRVPEALQRRQESLIERIRQLCDDVDPDEARMRQEIAVLVDKSDITEELVRARSHIKQFRQWLSADEPVGRKLDFLIQEINREVNTIGSKASDAAIALQVVDAKNELEKIREQVQNIM